MRASTRLDKEKLLEHKQNVVETEEAIKKLTAQFTDDYTSLTTQYKSDQNNTLPMMESRLTEFKTSYSQLQKKRDEQKANLINFSTKLVEDKLQQKNILCQHLFFNSWKFVTKLTKKFQTALEKEDVQRIVQLVTSHPLIFHDEAIINRQSARTGSTALHIAANKGSIDAVRNLLDCKANPLLLDKNGHSPRTVLTNHRDAKSINALLLEAENNYRRRVFNPS